MSRVLFQRPRGTAWQAKWTETFKTLIQQSAAPGFETRVSLGPDSVRHLELNYKILLAGDKGTTRDQLLGFFNLRGGDFDSFLLDLGAWTKNPTDSSIVGQVLTPDVNSFAPMQVTRFVYATETWNEDIYELAGVNGNPGVAPVLKLNGVPMTAGTDYVFQGPGVSVSGVTYPGMVAVIIHALSTSPLSVVTADFSYYYRMRFEQPQLEVEMFHWLLWKNQQMSLVQTRV
jgi:hypothetical protein